MPPPAELFFYPYFATLAFGGIHFTGMVLLQLEDYGFCGIGESGPFVADGNIRWPDGGLPVNTHGGNLSEAYIIGMTHVKEAVEQLRGEAVNQVADLVRTYATPGATTTRAYFDLHPQ